VSRVLLARRESKRKRKRKGKKKKCVRVSDGCVSCGKRIVCEVHIFVCVTGVCELKETYTCIYNIYNLLMKDVCVGLIYIYIYIYI
jgi:hypothetical protein